MKDIAKKLIEIRRENRLSPKEMAGRLGVPLSTYRAWESGSGMRAEALRRVATEFGVSSDELLGLGSVRQQSPEQIVDRVIVDLHRIRQILNKNS